MSTFPAKYSNTTKKKSCDIYICRSFGGVQNDNRVTFGVNFNFAGQMADGQTF